MDVTPAGYRGRVVASVIVVGDSRELEHTPGLVDLDPTDDVGNPRTAKVVVAIGGTNEGVIDVISPNPPPATAPRLNRLL